MSNNGANNEQWRMAGSKRNDIGGVRDSENQAEHNGAYSNEGKKGQLMQSMKPGGRKVQTGNTNQAGTAAGWTIQQTRRTEWNTTVLMVGTSTSGSCVAMEKVST
jgi:hypothetical protein